MSDPEGVIEGSIKDSGDNVGGTVISDVCEADMALENGQTEIGGDPPKPQAIEQGKEVNQIQTDNESPESDPQPTGPGDVLNTVETDSNRGVSFDDEVDDRMSMEVQLGGGSSRRASDVSTLSNYQNITIEEQENSENTDLDPESCSNDPVSSKIDSDSDSCPNDFTEADADTFADGFTTVRRLKDEVEAENYKYEEKLKEKVREVEEKRKSGELDHISDDVINNEQYPENEKTESNEGDKSDGDDMNDKLEADMPDNDSCSKDANDVENHLEKSQEMQVENQDEIDAKLQSIESKDQEKDLDVNTQRSIPCNPSVNHSPREETNHLHEPESINKLTDNIANTQGALAQEVANKHAQLSSAEIEANANSNSGILTSSNDKAINSNSNSTKNMAGQKPVTSSKRNSLEIRNNIPDVTEIKNYQQDDIDIRNTTQATAVPKIKKKSPGLAQRVQDQDEDYVREYRDTSSSEREVDIEATRAKLEASITQQVEHMVNSNSREGSLSPRGTLERIKPSLNDLQAQKEQAQMTENKLKQEQSERNDNRDVENEYDYIKYARVQADDGNSYVGMRLAFSTSNDSIHSKGAVLSDASAGSSREPSPDKTIVQSPRKPNSLGEIQSNLIPKISEETLTDGPVNNSDTVPMDDSKHFTLSPELTECDSAEVESVLSEGRSEGGMPTVEDGLSSSQNSDTEDPFYNELPHNPSELLKQRVKEQINLQLVDPQEVVNGIIERSNIQQQEQKKALELAMKDIKTAINETKQQELESPYAESLESTQRPQHPEPVWVMRDAYLKHNEEFKKAREEAQLRQQDDLQKRENDRVYELEEDDRLLAHQYTRNDGKVYQPGRGYSSDDDYDDYDQDRRHHFAKSRKQHGSKYSSIPNNEDAHETEQFYQRNKKPSTRTHSNEHKMTSYSDSNSYVSDSRNNGNAYNDVQEDHTVMSAYDPTRYTEEQYKRRSFTSDEDDIRDETQAVYIREPREGEYDTDEETDQLLDRNYVKEAKVDIPELSTPPVNRSAQAEKRRTRAKEVQINDPDDPSVLIEGVLFRAKYLGSTQLISDSAPSKGMRMMQAQEAVGRIKAPEGESQPSTEVDLFVSTEKIMVLNTDLQEIMMDHSLRSISYIADIGDIVVIMAKRRMLNSPSDDSLRRKKQAKIVCHVFESDEAQLIAQSIGQAFQVAYMEFLRANGIEDPGLMKEIDYQEVLNQQEIFGEELNLFSKKELQKEVIVPKAKGELLGVVVVESGWGSMVPTVVLANMCPTGPAARCGQLNIGDQIISVNGISLVGLPLSSCQNYIKAVKNQTVVKMTVVSCPPVVEVLIKRPDVKYQLGFSVQNGVICSLLRGGIAERGGVRVGHRIIEINGNSVVAVPHEKIVNMLASSVGEIAMKTMPTSIFRLLTGLETPVYI
ncbi:unnamed protein product [Owenia fusiformis]|uniref:Uncharacterized protein n=1 Tax=Owenia fusiformis TaxID=6347 RepID=A0A8S4PX94_OWEFU|nr:unnamed protein product [Owenia fusiformis]